MRQFVQTLIVAGCAAVALSVFNGASAAEVKVKDCLVGPWQLFIDDHLVASKHNVVRRYHPFRKHAGNPLIEVDQPWEEHVVNACSVLANEDGTGFRMYYYCWTPEGDKSRSYMCYATSKDGLKWEKPKLGLYDWQGNSKGAATKENNILPDGCASVMYTPWETDPAKRYHGVGGMYHARASADGINWKPLSEEKIVSGGDTSHFYWDPHVKRFRCNVKVGTDVRGLRRRCVGFSETNDLTKYPPLRMIMAPDDIDDLWCKPGTVQRTHFYACPVTPYETMYVGFLQIYRAAEPEGYFHGPLWLELASSRDGMRWNRSEPDTTVRNIYSLQDISRPPLLNIGKFREFDDGMVIAPPPLLVGDELWAYYTGYEELHDLLPYKSAIGLAKLRKDGFASLDADEVMGEIVTKQFTGADGTLLVNCNPRGGSIRVELLDADGKVIPGYSRDDCTAVTKNGVRQAVTWKNNKELPGDGRPVRFRFVMEHAQLFSFMPGEKVRMIEEQAGPVLQALYTFEGDIDSWSDMLGEDGLQPLRNLGTCVMDSKKPAPAFGKRSLVIGSEFRPLNRVEILGTDNLGTHFTLAAMVKSTNNKHSRLFSAYNGNSPVNTSELIFDFDPRGTILGGLRLFCKGMQVQSNAVAFADEKYHHLAVVYDNGEVTFYLDGKSVGQAWVPGGEPVKLARNLMIGEDLELGSDEQLQGNVDDVLVLGRCLSGEDIQTLAAKGAAVLFKLGG
ncbi:MAG TPA: LamG-like jellyroll fold domain-containing protein [Phycisphaerae bacterium]|nr:LamG-like jellyroll fold domain-containing protein [Phycisphaerae bacterium]